MNSTSVADHRILVVDDDPNNLDLLRLILREKYSLSFVKDGRGALKLAGSLAPDLILLDVMMPDMDGYEVCKKLKTQEHTADIPVIFTTALSDTIDEQRGFDVGAVDYITKPISGPIVEARIATHLRLYKHRQICEQTVRERTAALAASHHEALEMLGIAGHFYDNETALHLDRIEAYTGLLARELGVPGAEVELMSMASVLHDTGKIGIPNEIIRKPGTLDPEERKIVETHTTIGYQILSRSKAPLFELAARIALCHHEKWDGTGYPNHLSGEDIPLSARIVAIGDVFDALSTERSYKAAWPRERVLDTILAGSEGQFDPRVLEVFEQVSDQMFELLYNADESYIPGAGDGC